MKFIFLFVFIILGCKSSTKINPNELVWGYSGWGVSPDKIQNPISLSKDENLEYFYMVAGGKALPRAIELDSQSFMESTCKISALRENTDQIMSLAILSVKPKAAKDSALMQKGKEVLKEKQPNIAYCRPTGSGDKYSTCDCVIYIKYDGGQESLKKAL